MRERTENKLKQGECCLTETKKKRKRDTKGTERERAGKLRD